MNTATKAKLLVVWAALVAVGMAGLVRYQLSPGSASAAVASPDQWPAAAGIPCEANLPTLVLVLHPKCPCSVATLRELNVLISRAANPLAVDIYFDQPARAPADWVQGDLWRQAASIPGVRIAIDKDGKIARAFNATTSGDVSLYSADGNLLFKGGITDSRGHEGDNPGLFAVLALESGHPSQVHRTAVFGCPLDD
jgi:hypothetical protein